MVGVGDLAVFVGVPIILYKAGEEGSVVVFPWCFLLVLVVSLAGLQ